MTLKDLIDVPRLQALLAALDELRGLSWAIVDAGGTLVAGSAAQEICARFHRCAPGGASPCPFGLVEADAPIVVDGRPLGRVRVGQVLTAPPDEAAFAGRARGLGFDETAYLGALRRVPVVAPGRLRGSLAFLARLTETLAELGLTHLRHLESEAALRGSADGYRALFEAESDAIVLIDNETGRILEANGAAAALYGFTREELLGMRNTDLSAEPEQTRQVTTGTPLIESRVVRIPLRRHRKKDGSVFPVEITGRFFTSAGRGVHIAAIRDITERERDLAQIRDLNANLEQRVAARTRELQDANQELEALVYTIAHDLRAPLRAVDGYAGILEEDHGARLDAEGRRLLTAVRTGARGMDRLINDLLEYSRKGGRAELRRAPVDMKALVEAVWDETATAEERRTFRFTVGDLPPAEGDAALLRQVWSNLLANAVKFTLPRAERSIAVEGFREDGMVTYRVRDSGIGFDPAHAHQLFGMFQRLHAPGAFAGSGIGLVLVRRIVARHGGSVRAEGAVDAGATFSFSLPERAGTGC